MTKALLNMYEMKTSAKTQISSTLLALLSLVALAFVFTFTSCESNAEELDSNVAEIIETEDYAAQNLEDLDDLADEAFFRTIGTKTVSFGILPDCATVTREISNDTVTLTLTFETDCLCNDNRIREGSVIIKFWGNYWDDQRIIMISTDNYFVDGNQVIAEKTITRTLSNDEGFRERSYEADIEIILADNAGTILWHGERSRELIEGSETHSHLDDIIRITGESEGTTPNGETFSCVITEPLIRKMEIGCRQNFVEGVITITRPNGDVIIIDFGEGDCDNETTINMNGEVITHTMQHRFRQHNDS